MMSRWSMAVTCNATALWLGPATCLAASTADFTSSLH